MKRYTFNIIQRNSEGETFDQNVWVEACSRQDAEQQVRSEYWGVIDITLLRMG